MPGSSKHSWNYEVFDPKSQWLFVNPSESAESLGLYILELGHFFQDGRCYTDRVPENSFALLFTNDDPKQYSALTILNFPDKKYRSPSLPRRKGVCIVDNRSGYTIEQNGSSESYFIQFGGFMAEKYCQMILNNEKCREFVINWLPSLIQTFEQLVLLYRQPSNERRDIYASMLMTQILSRIILESDSERPLYAENKYVKRTLEIIEERFSEPLKLSKIAEELHVNSSYLSRLFASETGISFSVCLNHVRINRAKELLRVTNMSIEEIGAKCGFCNASHFVKQFHLNDEITPLQYRLQYRRALLPDEKI
ncbi:MAG: helix-turn-helix transcriptional regulator [Lachnospiraceae bacterium]|nr:helix-turn-helix transcriptional regulator [Lachnospiraceae bacterium]